MFDSPSKPFKIYSSSAGSGKTYTLSKEYLYLALQDQNYFPYILAVTFTNKATGEMKQRIVEYLVEFTQGKTGSMGKELAVRLSVSEQELIERSERVLKRILHQYTAFSVQTIDSFFQKVIRSFAKETGIHSGMRLELDASKAQSSITDDLMQSIGKDKKVTDWIIEMSMQNIDDSKSWDVKSKIRNFTRELFTEVFKENRILIEESGKAENIDVLTKELKTVVEAFENKQKEKATTIKTILLSHGLEAKDFAQGGRGIYKYILDQSAAGNRPPNTYALKVFNTGEWTAKKGTNKELVDALAQKQLQPLLEQLIGHYQSEVKNYTTAVVVQKNLYLMGLISKLSTLLHTYKEENNVFLISDSSDFLNQIVVGSDAPFIYEKTGSWFNHYLIDEFQDTSNLQWKNFKPLIENSLSQGYFNMVVGDVKQSIYRWRGGDWQLLLHGIEKDIGALLTERENLATNYRSQSKVIQFNNAFFLYQIKYLVQHALDSGETSSEALQILKDKIESAYEDVAQKTPVHLAEANEGFVTVKAFPKEEAVTFKEQVLEALPGQLERLQDQGYVLEDVAFLVRTSAEASLLVNFMMDFKTSKNAREGYVYDVISDEALKIYTSESVTVMLAYLKWAINPDDDISRTIVQSWIQEASEKKLLPDTIYVEKLMGPENIKEPCFQLPLIELVEELLRAFALNQVQREMAYIQRFKDVIFEYMSNFSSDIAGFLEWWAEKGHTFVIMPGKGLNAARILTIHKSKGLQFKVVMVPFCNWSGLSGKNEILWAHSDLLKENGMIPLTYSNALAGTHFAPAFYFELFLRYKDDLNLLYVAFTRAEEGLVVYTKHSESKKSTSVSAWINACIANPAFELSSNYDEEGLTFTMGQLMKKEDAVQDTTEAVHLPEVHSIPWLGRISVRTAYADLFDGQENDKINYGLLVHDFLASIEYASDLEYASKKFLSQGFGATQVIKKQVIDKVKKMLQNEQIKTWFDPSWEVKNEMNMLDGQGNFLRPDRVIILGGKAVVIDYKTGGQNKMHSNQVQEYMEVVSEMGYEQVEGYLLYLENIEIVKV